MKFLIIVLLLLCSCAATLTAKQSTPIGVILDLKIQANFERCKDLDNYSIHRHKAGFIGTAECIR